MTVLGSRRRVMQRLGRVTLCAVALSGLVACGDDTEAVGEEPLDRSTFFYLIDTVHVPIPGSEPVAGFNLDAIVSTGNDAESCSRPDYTGPLGTEGVDNQLAPIAQAIQSEIDVNQTLADAIGEGTFAAVLEVSGVDSRTTDDSISLRLSLGYPVGGGTAPQLGADGRPLPGQAYDYRPLASAQGRIVGGRIETDAFDVSTSITLVDPPAALDLSDLMVGVAFSPERLTGGMLGGALQVSQVAAAVAALQPDYADLAESVLNNNADLYPDAMGACQGISAGFSFTAVQAVMGEELPAS